MSEAKKRKKCLEDLMPIGGVIGGGISLVANAVNYIQGNGYDSNNLLHNVTYMLGVGVSVEITGKVLYRGMLKYLDFVQDDHDSDVPRSY